MSVRVAKYIIGIDEVGRGPLAGPICVGAVLIPEALSWKDFHGLKDSKQLSAQKREEWAARAENDARVRFATAMVSAPLIDRMGITRAAHLAVARSLKRLKRFSGALLENCKIVLDAGLRAPKNFKDQESIVRGDETEVSIALASIVAKVRRDAYMARSALRYPNYGFEIHKGYSTALHRRAIMKSGLCPLHRRSFCTKLRNARKSL